MSDQGQSMGFHLGNGGSFLAVVSAVLGVLPTILTVIATTLAILWYCVMLHESQTFRRLWTRRERISVPLEDHNVRRSDPGPTE